ncbi:cupin domain-containing protein, partial [Aeromonas caviae]|uniref:cupin domain-containing protein n=2 Tax=Aeromonas caviae TaxID=648 RepID=UPI0038D1FEF2
SHAFPGVGFCLGEGQEIDWIGHTEYSETRIEQLDHIFNLIGISTNNVRIERILSQGQQTPTGEWFDQDEHEWVLLVQGEAILVFITPDTGVQERVHLGPGDYINIPAHLQHRVEWTHPTETTVWLCVYY